MARTAPPALDQSQLLDSVPTRNTAVRTERRAGTVVLWVPIVRRWWMKGPLGWVLPFRNEKGVALDALGEEVWAACDGKQRLEQIIEHFAKTHRIRFHEARVSVLSFVRSLSERNLVGIVVPGAATGGGDPG